MDDGSALDKDDILKKIDRLTAEHRALDNELLALVGSANLDQLHIQRLKKQKLAIKDQIRILEDMLIPDIIA